MRYIYCMDCGNPIRAESTFYEAVILGKTHTKKLEASCAKSFPEGFEVGRCKSCQLKIMKQFGKTECEYPNCRKNNNGFCDYLLNKNLELR